MPETPPRETLPPELVTLIDALIDASFDHGVACQRAPTPKHLDPDVQECVAELKAAHAALESSLGAMVAELERAGVPDIVSIEGTDDWVPETDLYQLTEDMIPGTVREVHANRILPMWWAAHIVTSRNDDGTPDETDVQIFPTEAAALAALRSPHNPDSSRWERPPHDVLD